jgi:hypothetical protein
MTLLAMMLAILVMIKMWVHVTQIPVKTVFHPHVAGTQFYIATSTNNTIVDLCNWHPMILPRKHFAIPLEMLTTVTETQQASLPTWCTG